MMTDVDGIYKDIKEAEYYDNCNKEEEFYGTKRRGIYYEDEELRHERDHDERHNRSYPLDEREERYITRMREGLYNYDAGRMRYRDGGSKEKMIDGVDMAMGALVNFVEFMLDNVETSQEKEVIRKHIDKLKQI